MREIARRIGKSPSTVSREINRNGGTVKYMAITADNKALERALRPKQSKLQKDAALSKIVEAKLLADWSTEQIAGWLKITYPLSPEMLVSHDTIYKTLFKPFRYVFDKVALTHLRSKRKLRHGKRSSNKGHLQGSY